LDNPEIFKDAVFDSVEIVYGNVDDVDDVGKIPAFLCQNKIITGWVWEKQYNFINDTKDIPIDLLNKQVNPIFGE
jgi:hypothetical protein